VDYQFVTDVFTNVITHRCKFSQVGCKSLNICVRFLSLTVYYEYISFSAIRLLLPVVLNGDSIEVARDASVATMLRLLLSISV